MKRLCSLSVKWYKEIYIINKGLINEEEDIMKKSVSLIMIMAMLVLTVGCTEYHARGAGIGGAFGGAAGRCLTGKTHGGDFL